MIYMSIKHEQSDETSKIAAVEAAPRSKNRYRRGRARLTALRYGRPARRLKLIAVVGADGRTVTANFINEILKEAGFKTALSSSSVVEIAGRGRVVQSDATTITPARWQSFLGKAKKAKVDYVVAEISDQALEQYQLAGTPLEALVVTNLTGEYIDQSEVEYRSAAIRELLEIAPRFVVLSRDDGQFDYLNNFQAGEQKISYGWHDEAEVKILSSKYYKKGSEARLLFDSHIEAELATALPGPTNVGNLTAAVALAYLLGVQLEDIVEGAAKLETVPGWFEIAVESADSRVIVDYSHTPNALGKLLTDARVITRDRLILAFGASDDHSEQQQFALGRAAAAADRIILTDGQNRDEAAQTIRETVSRGIVEAGGDGKTTEVPDRRQAIERAMSIAKKGDTVLIAGLGHLEWRLKDGKKVPWNDAAVVREVARGKRG